MSDACPTPSKRSYRTQHEALRAAIGSSATFATGTRTYRCSCNRWHVTHRLPRWSGGASTTPSP